MRNRSCQVHGQSVPIAFRASNIRWKGWEDSTMPHTKRVWKRKYQKEAVPVVGVVGVSLSLAGGASAATAVPAAEVPSWDTSPPQITLSEEEIADVSLGTFYVFDKENAETPRLGEKFAPGCGRCGGLRTLRRLRTLRGLQMRQRLRLPLRRLRLWRLRLRRLRLLLVVGSLPHLLGLARSDCVADARSWPG